MTLSKIHGSLPLTRRFILPHPFHVMLRCGAERMLPVGLGLRVWSMFFLAMLISFAFLEDSKGQTSLITLEYLPPHWLVLHGDHIPGKEIHINYLEAYCRAGSTDSDWVQHTVIKHVPESILLSEDKVSLKFRDKVSDGVVVDHEIVATSEEVTFRIHAQNLTSAVSEIHWAQPCIRLGDFTGFGNKGKDIDDYLPKCFLFVDGQLARMNTIVPWSKKARYVPGQVWCPKNVPRTDVNPRPLSEIIPSNGLIGCFSGDENWLFAVAFEPYQELFQGVARCLHSDFRIGGLNPGESKRIFGKIYLIRNDPKELLRRYERDFPGHLAIRK